MENTKEKNKNIQNITREIIQKAKEGEQKAQFQLYKYYFNSMFKTSLDIVKDEGKAADILNEAFLKAFDTIETYDDQNSFDNWLENIVVYQSKTKLENSSLKKIPVSQTKNKHLKEKSQFISTFTKTLMRPIKKILPDQFRSLNKIL